MKGRSLASRGKAAAFFHLHFPSTHTGSGSHTPHTSPQEEEGPLPIIVFTQTTHYNKSYQEEEEERMAGLILVVVVVVVCL